jgi:polyhydroxyalkanoate synthesis repressor PhaR
MTTLIKRYSNRKLYNTETSRYITLKGIAELIEHGDEVRVIDNETGEDITSIALSQILVDSERSQRAVPGSVLSDLIQKGGDALYGARATCAAPSRPARTRRSASAKRGARRARSGAPNGTG